MRRPRASNGRRTPCCGHAARLVEVRCLVAPAAGQGAVLTDTAPRVYRHNDPGLVNALECGETSARNNFMHEPFRGRTGHPLGNPTLRRSRGGRAGAAH